LRRGISISASDLNSLIYKHGDGGGKASPLDRDVKLAPDEKTAVKIANSMVEENIKKVGIKQFRPSN